MLEALVNGIVTPASAVSLSFTWLMGADAEPLTAWVIAGSVVVPLGIMLYEGATIWQFIREKKPPLSAEEQEALLAVPPLRDDANIQGPT